MLPDLPPLLRPDLPRGQGQGAGRGLRRRLQRLHGRGVVRRQRRPAAPAVHHPAVGRREGGRRGAAQRGPRRARRVLQRDPAAPRPAQHPQRRTGIRSSPPARRPGTVVCMHIGSSSKMPATSADAPVAVAATLSFGNAMSSLCRLPLLRRPHPLPPPCPGLLGGPDRLAALHPRAGGRRLARAPRLGWREGHRPRAALHLLPPPGLRLLLPRPARARLPRRHRRRPHHLRDRLPPHRLHLARHPCRGRADGAGPLRRGRVPDHAGQRHCDARPRQGP